MERGILLLGGDGRSRGVADGLRARFAFPVLSRYGKSDGAASLEELRTARAVVLPIPVSEDGERLYCPEFSGEAPFLRPIFGEFPAAIPVFGGRITQPVSIAAAERGIRIRDMLTSEEVLLRNAHITAEGAAALTANHLNRTVWGAKIAVLGYGRIGEPLARRLAAWGARVTVAARRPAVLTRIACDGFAPLAIDRAGENLLALCDGFDAICNTVPARLLPENITAAMHTETVLVELASAPGGWNPSGQIGATVLYAPGLPAVYAPRSAGEILADYIASFLTGEEAKS